MYVNRKHLFGIAGCIITSIMLVVVLAWVALGPLKRDNGFRRKFLETKMQIVAKVEKDELITSVAGKTASHIYFKTKDPSKLYVTNADLNNGSYISLNVPNNQRIASAFYCRVDSPNVEMLAGNGPAIIKANLNESKIEAYKFPKSLFSRAVKISDNSYVFRAFDFKSKSGQVFIKGNPRTGQMEKTENFLSTSSDKPGILTDGYLNYDEQTKTITYVSFYTNRFYCLDTNLNVLLSGKTIDTVSSYQITTTKVRNTLTSNSPSKLVNGKSIAYNGKLYNMSKLRADNETWRSFTRNTVVDIYDIEQGAYKGSIYIPFDGSDRVLDFGIVGDKIIAVYKNKLILYSGSNITGNKILFAQKKDKS